jgi:transcriptional regulator with XRE-family HTH domain
MDAPHEDPGRLFDWITATHNGWGWSQRKMAEACRVTPNALRNWKAGTHPGANTLAATAAATGVTVEALRAVMRGEDVTPPERPPGPRVVQGTTDEDLEARLSRLERRVELLVDAELRRRSGG